MSGVSDVLERLKGRKPTDEELRRIYAISNALQMSENDVFLSLIVALDHYYGMYTHVPEAINKATEKAANLAVETTKSKISELVAKQEAKLAEAIYISAEKASKAASTKTMLKWITGAIIACGITMSGTSYFAFEQGRQAGIAIAQDKDLRLKERDAWTKTKMYKLAYAYSKNGLLESILQCKRKGWETERSLKGEKYCKPDVYTENGKPKLDVWEMPDIEE